MKLEDRIPRADATVILELGLALRVVLLVEQVDSRGLTRALSAVPDPGIEIVDDRRNPSVEPPSELSELPRVYVPDYPHPWAALRIAADLGSFTAADFLLPWGLGSQAQGRIGVGPVVEAGESYPSTGPARPPDFELFWSTVGPGMLAPFSVRGSALLFNAAVQRKIVAEDRRRRTGR